VCESRKNTLPYPFGSTTEFKIRFWIVYESKFKFKLLIPIGRKCVNPCQALCVSDCEETNFENGERTSMASTPVRRAPHSEELLVKAYTTQEYPPRAIPRNRGDSVTSSASRRGPPAQQKPSGRPARRGQVTVVGGGQHVACYCPQCLAAAGLSKLDGKRTPNWHQSSPYLEDLTKSLVISQPARRKVHLVPPRRAHAAASPYETSLPTRAAPKLRTQVQVRDALALPSSGSQCRPNRLPPTYTHSKQALRAIHALP